MSERAALTKSWYYIQPKIWYRVIQLNLYNSILCRKQPQVPERRMISLSKKKRKIIITPFHRYGSTFSRLYILCEEIQFARIVTFDEFTSFKLRFTSLDDVFSFYHVTKARPDINSPWCQHHTASIINTYLKKLKFD